MRTDVQSVDFGASPAAHAALLGGSIDLYPTSGTNQMLLNGNTVSGPKQLVQVYSHQSAAPSVLLARRELAAGKSLQEAMRSLKGKTFGVPALGSEGRALARALLKHAGPDAERDVSYLAVGLGPQAVASFQAKQADAVVAFTPVTIVLEEKGAHTVFDMAGSKGIELLTRWTVAVYVTTREKATADADKLRRLQQAWQRHPPSPGTR